MGWQHTTTTVRVCGKQFRWTAEPVANRFSELRVANWRQYGDVDIRFHPRLTVLTGANGAGKTTLLNVLSRHFGWSSLLVSTLRPTQRGALRYVSGLAKDIEAGNTDETIRVGHVRYSDGSSGLIRVPVNVQENYELRIQNQQEIPGIFLPSHRPMYSYQKVEQIPTSLDATRQMFDNYIQNVRQWYVPRARMESPSYRLKSALISLAVFGYGSQVVTPNFDAIQTFEGFQEILRHVLPSSIGFRRLVVRMPDVVFECQDYDFSLDAASGGIAAIVDTAWQIYIKSLIDPLFVVVADEPENHLHPELQRSLLPGLLAAFPQAQFIVATHNPFVVTAVPDSYVFVLEFLERRVFSKHLHDSDMSGSANQILSDVLGIPLPLPLWVEDRIEEVARRIATNRGQLSEEYLRSIRAEMASAGLGHLFPEALDRFLAMANDD